jgi:hypothetical protein
VNGLQAFLGAASAWAHRAYLVAQPLVRAMFDTVANVSTNRPEPARDVVVSLAVLVALIVLVVPRIAKKVMAK